MGVGSRKLLKLLSSMGEVFSLNDLSMKSNLSSSTLRKYIKELIRMGYITEKNGLYIVSEKAKFVTEGEEIGRRVVNEGSAYLFTDEKGLPIPLRIDSVEKLYIAIKYRFVPPEIVVEHITRGYLTKWLTDILGAKMLVKRLSNSKSIDEILKVLEEYVGY